MNELTAAQSSTPSSTTWPSLTRPLMVLLCSGERASSIDRIAMEPKLLAEGVAALPALKAAAMAIAGEDGVRRVVKSRFGTFPQPQRSHGEWLLWWRDYFDVCADVPEESLEAGMRQWLRDPDAEYLPKPGKLREISRSQPTRSAEAHLRIQEAVKRAQELRPMDVDHAAPVSRAAIASLMEGFLAKSKSTSAQASAYTPSEVLAMDPDQHEAMVWARHDAAASVVDWANAEAELNALPANAKDENRQEAKKRTADAIRAMADRLEKSKAATAAATQTEGLAA